MADVKSALKGIKNPLHNTSVHGKAGIGGAALQMGIGAFLEMRQGESFSTAALKQIPSTVAWAVAPGVMTAYTAISAAPALANAYIMADQRLKSTYNQNHRAGTNFSYMDTQQALTMRQASVQAIQGSKLNARNALGGEASLMHRSYSDRMGI